MSLTPLSYHSWFQRLLNFACKCHSAYGTIIGAPAVFVFMYWSQLQSVSTVSSFLVVLPLGLVQWIFQRQQTWACLDAHIPLYWFRLQYLFVVVVFVCVEVQEVVGGKSKKLLK